MMTLNRGGMIMLEISLTWVYLGLIRLGGIR